MKPDTKAIRARADAATKGEWRARRHGRHFTLTAGLPGVMLVIGDVYNDDPPHGGTDGEPDAKFIAAARSDVPALCDRVEALEAALRNLHALFIRASTPELREQLRGELVAAEEALEGE